MCRILSISGKIENNETNFLLKDFQRLAEYGVVPKGSGKGHQDGWGIVAYKKRKPILFVRNYKNAFRDLEYSKTIKKLENKKSDIIIGHLRKASVGIKNINNAHPFVWKKYSFCQNGTIFGSEKIPLKSKFKKMLKGETDSEKFFIYILQFLKEQNKSNPAAIRSAIKKAIISVRKNFDFTAINMLFSDGRYIWALHEVNEVNKYVIEKNLLGYYSLFFGAGNKYIAISSEKLAMKGIKWKAIKNHELLELENGKVRSRFNF